LRFGPTDHKKVFIHCLERLHDRSGCLRSVAKLEVQLHCSIYSRVINPLVML